MSLENGILNFSYMIFGYMEFVTVTLYLKNLFVWSLRYCHLCELSVSQKSLKNQFCRLKYAQKSL